MTGDLHPDAAAAADVASPATTGAVAEPSEAASASGGVQQQLDDLAYSVAAMQQVIRSQGEQLRVLRVEVRMLKATEDGEPA